VGRYLCRGNHDDRLYPSYSAAQGPLDPQGGTNTHEFTFTGALSGDTITGSRFHLRIINGTAPGTFTFNVTLRR
jgi:hypothetical protein